MADNASDHNLDSAADHVMMQMEEEQAGCSHSEQACTVNVVESESLKVKDGSVCAATGRNGSLSVMALRSLHHTEMADFASHHSL